MSDLPFLSTACAKGKTFQASLSGNGNFDSDSHLSALQIVAWADRQIAAGKLSPDGAAAVHGVRFFLAQIDNAHRRGAQPHHITIDMLKEQLAKLEAANAC